MYFVAQHPFDDGAQTIIRAFDNATVPCDPANTDYQQYLAWLAEGGVPEPWNPEVVE